MAGTVELSDQDRAPEAFRGSVGVAIGEPAVTVVFLARGADNGEQSCTAFFATYDRHPAGIAHALLVVLKGWRNSSHAAPVSHMAKRRKASVLEFPDDGFDLGAYFRAISSVKTEWVCFLNENSRIVADDWLSKLYVAADHKDVGAAGSTASWESGYRNAVNAFRQQGRPLVRRILTMIYSALHYPRFPNPHIRSNAFIVRTSLFREFAGQRKIPSKKRHAHLLESGKAGLSAFICRCGYELVVVDAKGKAYRSREWRDSRTFRTDQPVSVLVEDNQTRFFASADPATRESLQDAAWGSELKAGSS